MAAVLAMIEVEPMIGGMAEGRLEWHFDNWRRFMRRGDVTDGYPRKGAGCVGGGYSQTFDDMADAADIRVAGIMDALVKSLPPMENAAIHHEYLYAVFRFSRDNFKTTLAAARLRLARWLVSRGVY